MKRFMTIAITALLVMAPAAALAQGTPGSFGWTISNSTTSPYVNSGPIAPGPSMFAGNLYLWLACGNGVNAGMSAAEFDIVELAGGGNATGFTPMNGFLNAGGPTNLILAKGGCPTGSPSILAGSFSVGPDAFISDIELCLAPSAANNRNITVECGTGQGHLNDYIGFRKTGNPCRTTTLCPVTGVEPNTWGSIKGLYR